MALVDYGKLSEELQEYAELEGTELGEYCRVLVRLRDFNESHGMSKEFSTALNTEISNLLAEFKEHCEIIELEDVVVRTIKELSWREE